jgi:tetratricopeptide (TPR) repeat protein
VVEDLQQADESSLLLIYHLARAARQLPIKIVGTVRDEGISVSHPLHTLLSGLSRERLVTRLDLGPLAVDATRALIHDLCDDAPAGELSASIVSLCEGNPFFVHEVVGLMRERGFEGAASPSDDLVRTIRGRVASLGPTAEKLLTMAAVAGLRFDFDVVCSASKSETADALDALDLALAARIVEEHGEQYRFHHALTREALYASLSKARCTHAHRAVAEALEQATDTSERQPEILAFHHGHAGAHDRALPHVIAAVGNAQSRLGFSEAVAFCEQGLEIMQKLELPVGPQQFDLQVRMGQMRVALGDTSRAIRDLDAAAALHDESGWRPGPSERAHALRLAGLALIEAGDLAAAEAHLDDSLAAVSDAPDSGVLTAVFYLYAQVRWHQGRHADAYEMAERCLLEAEKLDDAKAVAKGYEMLALACHSLGDWKKGTDYEKRRSELSTGALDVASAFDGHL